MGLKDRVTAKKLAVIISDVHYSLPTLTLADECMRQAIKSSNEFQIPLIVAGDLHDTKANMRAECVNAMIKTFKVRKQPTYIISGNHDRVHEKSWEHALDFLTPYVTHIVTGPFKPNDLDLIMLPYYSDPKELCAWLLNNPQYETLVMHQGIKDSNSGDYIQDKSAITKYDVAGRRVVSGHYHQRQDITLPGGGLWSYVGNPYTLNWGEANDPEKGYRILYDDGSLEFISTNLRKHVIFECNTQKLVNNGCPKIRVDDLLWVKLTGTREELATFTRSKVASYLPFDNFKLDLIPTDTETQVTTQNVTAPELLDGLIDSLTNTSDETKLRLKDLWKGIQCD